MACACLPPSSLGHGEGPSSRGAPCGSAGEAGSPSDGPGVEDRAGGLGGGPPGGELGHTSVGGLGVDAAGVANAPAPPPRRMATKVS